MQVRSLGQEGPLKERAWQPTPAFLPGEFHRQRGLMGYSPQSHTESDTKWQHACTHISINKEQLESFSQNLWRNKAKSYSLQEEFWKHHHGSNLKSAVTDVCLPKAAAAEGAGLPFLPLTTPCNTRDQKGGLRGSRTWTIKEQVQTPSSPLDQELAGVQGNYRRAV